MPDVIEELEEVKGKLEEIGGIFDQLNLEEKIREIEKKMSRRVSGIIEVEKTRFWENTNLIARSGSNIRIYKSDGEKHKNSVL